MSRKALKPSDEQRHLVRVLSSYGIRQEDIATEVALRSPKTLRKHFREELDHGRIGANIRVAKTLYTMATSGKHLSATMFWLERRAGWRSKAPRETQSTVIPQFVVASSPTECISGPTRPDGSLLIGKRGVRDESRP
jgi:hypothetical protein